MIPQNHLPGHKELNLQLQSLRLSSFSVALLKLLVILIKILCLGYSMCDKLKYLCVMLALALDVHWWTMCSYSLLNRILVSRECCFVSQFICKPAWGASTQRISFFWTLAQLSPHFPLAIWILSAVQHSPIFKDESKHALPSRHMRTFICTTQEPHVDVWFGHWLVAMATLNFDSWNKCNIRHHRI